MTNVVPLRAEDFDDGEPTGVQLICRQFMNDALAELKALVLEFQQLQAGYPIGSNAFDYRDRHFNTIIGLRNRAKDLCGKYEKRGNELGVPREIIDMMLAQIIPPMRQSTDNVANTCQMWIDRERPKEVARFAPLPSAANDPQPHVMSWGHPVGATVGIISIIGIIIMLFAGGLKPYGWAGIHNGHISHGYGLRVGSGRHH